jgi:4-amino-4-deoxychorismate lyase
MSLLIESIKLLDGNFYNISHHEERMNRSLKMLCGVEERFDLARFLQKVENPSEGLYKCRITYDELVQDVEFLPYVPKPVTSLRVVEHDRISYEFKYKDRSLLDRLYGLRKDCDDILIVKQGFVTDSSYSNVVFKRKNKWYTPWSALLKGTMRQTLIEKNLIQEEDIHVDDIASFESCKLINALLEFDGPEIDVSRIVF